MEVAKRLGEEDLELRLKNEQTFPKEQVRLFKKIIGSSHFERVLEVGCNDGFWTYIARKQFDEVILSDVFITSILRDAFLCKGRSSIVRADGGQLPFPDNTFDLVFSIDVMEHVEDHIQFFDEQIRVCKPGGIVLMGTPNLWRPVNMLLKVLGRLEFPRTIGEENYGPVIHEREFSHRDLMRLIEQRSNVIESATVHPCYLGLGLYVGITRIPSPLTNHCQFWFVELKKRQEWT